MEEDAGETWIPKLPASRPRARERLKHAANVGVAANPDLGGPGPVIKVARECDPGMRPEFASENKPINRKQSRLFH